MKQLTTAYNLLKKRVLLTPNPWFIQNCMITSYCQNISKHFINSDLDSNVFFIKWRISSLEILPHLCLWFSSNAAPVQLQ